jgi:transcriptional regulator with XRE-family HTH domain
MPTASELFGEQLRAVRGRKDWSQEQLADEMSNAGLRMDRTTITKIENGARNVSIDEALAFAAVLGVSPAALLAPRDTTMLDLTPTRGWSSVTPDIAWDWFAGRSPVAPAYEYDASEGFDETIVRGLGEHQAEVNRFYYSETLHVDAEGERLLGGLHELFLGGYVLKRLVRTYVRQGDEALAGVHQQLRWLREDVATEIRKVERKMAAAGVERLDPLRRKAGAIIPRSWEREGD